MSRGEIRMFFKLKAVFTATCLMSLYAMGLAENQCDLLSPGAHWENHPGNYSQYGSCIYNHTIMKMTDKSTVSIQLSGGQPKSNSNVSCPDITTSVTDVVCTPSTEYRGSISAHILYDGASAPVKGDVGPHDASRKNIKILDIYQEAINPLVFLGGEYTA